MKNVLLFAAFISFNSFGQDKYTGMNGYLKVTQDNIYLMTWQNNAYTHITDMASLSFTDKAEAIELCLAVLLHATTSVDRVGHLGEDVVRRAVDDAEHASDWFSV